MHAFAGRPVYGRNENELPSLLEILRELKVLVIPHEIYRVQLWREQ